MVPLEEEMSKDRGTDKIEGGAFDGVMESKTPFMYKGGEGINAGVGEVEWVISKDRFVKALRNLKMKINLSDTSTTPFSTLSTPLMVKWQELALKVLHCQLKLFVIVSCFSLGEMIKSKLPNNVLGKIWKLADVDRDGMLDADEFSLAMHLMNIKLDGGLFLTT